MPRLNTTSNVIATTATRPGCLNSRRRVGAAAAGESAIDSEANAVRGSLRPSPDRVGGAADRPGAAGTVTRWRSPASPISPAVSSPVAIACSHPSVQARAVASTSPTTSGCKRRVGVKVLHLALGRGRRVPAPLPGRGPGGGVAATTRNVMAVYDWGEDDGPVHGARAAHRRQPARHARRRRAPDARRRPRTSGARSPAALAYAHAPRRRAPRHQARQPAVRRARHRARRRLRPRPRARRGELDRARGHGRRAPRATPRPSRRRARRSTAAPTCTRWRSCSSRRSPAPCPRSPTPPSARWPRARTRRSSRRSRSVASVRWSSAPAVPTRPTATPTRPRCAPPSPTPAARCPPPQPLTLAGLGGEIDGGPPTQIGRSSQLFDQDAPVAPPVVVDEPVRPHDPRAGARRARPAGSPTRCHRRRSCWRSSAAGSRSRPCSSGGGTVSRCRHSSASPRRRRPTRSRRPGSRCKIVHRARRRSGRHRDRAASRTGRVRERRRSRSSSSCPAARRRSPSPRCQRSSRPADAQAALEAQGFVVNVKHQYDETVPVDGVIGTDPAGGTKAARDSTVMLLVSDGPAPVPVPDVTGKTFDEASQLLTGGRLHRGARRRLQRHRREGQGDRHRSRGQPGREPRRAGHGAREQGPGDGGRARAWWASRSKRPSSSCRPRASRSTPRATCRDGVRAQSPAANTSVQQGHAGDTVLLIVLAAGRPASVNGGRRMGALDGRVAIITGAGRGLGREHALLFASEGAKVVVNDLGGDQQGGGADAAPAQQTVDDIRAMGGEAVVNGENVSEWEGARRLVEQAVDTFGDLHVLVNNAGILRDRVIVNMTEDEWDSVVRVHLKGHFAPDPLRGQLLARADQGGSRDQRRHRQHDVDVGPLLEPGAGQLRRREVGDRHAHAGDGEGTGALRRARERHRARRADADDVVDPGPGRSHGGAHRRLVRRALAGQRVADGRVPLAPPMHRSPVRRSWCAAGWCSGCRRGPWPRRSSSTIGGRSQSLAQRASELASRLPLERGQHGHPQYPSASTCRAARRLVK